MYKLTVFKEVATDRWRRDPGTGATFADDYLVFVRKLELPFVPAVGLQLQTQGWLPGPLTQLRYLTESQEFVAFVQEDNDIPDALSRMLGDSSAQEMDAWAAKEAESKKTLYQKLGWKLYNGKA